MICLYLIIPNKVNIVQMADRYDCQAITDIYTLLPPNRMWRITMALNRAVITCRLPLQTMEKGDIQQHLTNPDTMPTLVSDTLVSRAEPPPFGWTDVILEQTYKYWHS